MSRTTREGPRATAKAAVPLALVLLAVPAVSRAAGNNADSPATWNQALGTADRSRGTAGAPAQPATPAPPAPVQAPPAPRQEQAAPAGSKFRETQIRRPARRESSTPPAANATPSAPAPSSFDLPRVGLSLGVVVAVILLLKWFGGRFFASPGKGGRSSRAVQVLTRSPLSPRQQLVLLQVGRRLVLVADGGAQANTICEITDPDEVAALVGQLNEERFRAAGVKPFGSVFGRFRRRFDADDEDVSKAMAPDAFSGSDDRKDEDEDEDDDGGGRQIGRALGGPESPPDPVVTEARQELNGLLEKVRLITKQYKAPER